MRTIVAVIVMTLALCAAAVTGYSIGYHAHDTADITVQACTADPHTAPPFTFTGACVDQHGELHTR